VWSDGPAEAHAEAAISLDEQEAQRLAEFLVLRAPQARPSVLERLGLLREKTR